MRVVLTQVSTSGSLSALLRGRLPSFGMWAHYRLRP